MIQKVHICNDICQGLSSGNKREKLDDLCHLFNILLMWEGRVEVCKGRKGFRECNVLCCWVLYVCACYFDVSELNPPGNLWQEAGKLRGEGWYLQDGQRCTQCRGRRHRRAAVGEQWDWLWGTKATSRAEWSWNVKHLEIYWSRTPEWA